MTFLLMRIALVYLKQTLQSGFSFCSLVCRRLVKITSCALDACPTERGSPLVLPAIALHCASKQKMLLPWNQTFSRNLVISGAFHQKQWSLGPPCTADPLQGRRSESQLLWLESEITKCNGSINDRIFSCFHPAVCTWLLARVAMVLAGSSVQLELWTWSATALQRGEREGGFHGCGTCLPLIPLLPSRCLHGHHLCDLCSISSLRSSQILALLKSDLANTTQSQMLLFMPLQGFPSPMRNADSCRALYSAEWWKFCSFLLLSLVVSGWWLWFTLSICRIFLFTFQFAFRSFQMFFAVRYVLILPLSMFWFVWQQDCSVMMHLFSASS